MMNDCRKCLHAIRCGQTLSGFYVYLCSKHRFIPPICPDFKAGGARDFCFRKGAHLNEIRAGISKGTMVLEEESEGEVNAE